MVSTEIVDTIVRALNESAEGPRQKIADIVQDMGETAALELLAETQRIEESGGELVKKGSRKRTPGGVFFRLAKAQVSADARRRIFRSPHKPKPPKAGSEPGQSAAGQPQKALPIKPPQSRPQIGRSSPAHLVADAAARPRRRVIELGSIQQTPPPKPVQAFPQRAPAPKMVWTKPSQARVAPPAVSAPSASEDGERPARTRPVTRVVVAGESRTPVRPEEPIEQVRRALAKVPRNEAVAMLLGLLRELGYEPPAETVQRTSPAEQKEQEAEEGQRERILAAVVDALGLNARQLAAVLYRDDSISAVRRAEKALRRFRADG